MLWETVGFRVSHSPFLPDEELAGERGSSSVEYLGDVCDGCRVDVDSVKAERGIAVHATKGGKYIDGRHQRS